MSIATDLEASLERRHAPRARQRAIDEWAKSARRVAELQEARRSFETRRAQA